MRRVVTAFCILNTPAPPAACASCSCPQCFFGEGAREAANDVLPGTFATFGGLFVAQHSTVTSNSAVR